MGCAVHELQQYARPLICTLLTVLHLLHAWTALPSNWQDGRANGIESRGLVLPAWGMVLPACLRTWHRIDKDLRFWKAIGGVTEQHILNLQRFCREGMPDERGGGALGPWGSHGVRHVLPVRGEGRQHCCS